MMVEKRAKRATEKRANETANVTAANRNYCDERLMILCFIARIYRSDAEISREVLVLSRYDSHTKI